MLITPLALAQNNNGQTLNPPDFTTSALEAARDDIDDAEGLSEEQITQAKKALRAVRV